MTSPTLTDLIARVERAEGPSRILDTDIALALRIGGDVYPSAAELRSFHVGYVQANLGRDGWSVAWQMPTYTASLDAALALVEAVLPGAGGKVGWTCPGPGRPWAVVWPNAWHRKVAHAKEAHANAATPALALCLALLRAVAERGGA